jgi:hypothetical protein
MPQFSELSIYQGADFNQILTLTDDTTGLLLNVANYTITSNAKVSPISPNVAFSFTMTINDAANGNVSMTLPAGVSANVNPGRYVFDVKSKSPANVISPIIYGNIDLQAGIT